MNIRLMRMWLGALGALFLLLMVTLPMSAAPTTPNIILMIADGWGAKQIEAAAAYGGAAPPYGDWPAQHWMATWPAGGGYDPARAWSEFGYVLSNPTDSAAAATALYTGVKTSNGRISVSPSGARLVSIADKARALGKGIGAVSSVEISHATPGAWMAHNDSRSNGYAISDEGLFGHPNSTGTSADHAAYSGSHGPTLPPTDVVIGAGHPHWPSTGSYVNNEMRTRLLAEHGQPGKPRFVERIAGQGDGGARLLAAAGQPTTTALVGLFSQQYRLADGSGASMENATLSEMSEAALTVLERHPGGYLLMIEGGAVDWAGHDNRMNELIGEMEGFNAAVAAVERWLDDPTHNSTWSNTLVIVTGDHETGYLTARPGVFPNQPLGEVSPRTLALEQARTSGRRASWEDLDSDRVIDAGETVYWAWNSNSHSNSLIPLYARGVGAETFASYHQGTDPMRGPYLDNTAVFHVMDALLGPVPTAIAPTMKGTEAPSPMWPWAMLAGAGSVALFWLSQRHRRRRG